MNWSVMDLSWISFMFRRQLQNLQVRLSLLLEEEGSPVLVKMFRTGPPQSLFFYMVNHMVSAQRFFFLSA